MFILRKISILAFLFTSFVAVAMPVRTPCLDKAMPFIGNFAIPYHAQITTALSAFEDSKKILLLSDAADGVRTFSFADSIAKAYPDKLVVRSDYQFQGFQKDIHPWKVHMDHNKKFPFEDGMFDTIVMKRGLCLCGAIPGKTCGGVTPSCTDMTAFFKEVTRVLDLNNPKSKAILHGAYGVESTHLQQYIQAAQKLEELYPVNVEFSLRNGSSFYALTITPITQ